MDEKQKLLEGEKTDNLEGTSTSVEGGVQLNNSPVPTPEEKKEADMVASANESPDVSTEPAQPQSDTPTPNENVEPSAEANPADINANINDATPEIENSADTSATATPVPEAPIPEPEKTFTQSQVNDLVGKTRMETREQTYRAIYGRYGVEDEAGMDELVGNAQRYETLDSEYKSAKKGWEESSAARDNELAEIKEHVALLESGIDKNRFDDAKAIIRAKGQQVTVETIQNELATHPEWKGSQPASAEPNPNFRQIPNAQPQSQTPAPESTIKVLGNEGDNSRGGEMSEEDYVLHKLYKM